MTANMAFPLMIIGLLVGTPASATDRVARPVDARVAQANTGRMCAQVISYGTKNGVRKEYPTPCAAQDDGAINISPKTGPTCDNSK
jgi:hypothetical protein